MSTEIEDPNLTQRPPPITFGGMFILLTLSLLFSVWFVPWHLLRLSEIEEYERDLALLQQLVPEVISLMPAEQINNPPNDGALRIDPAVPLPKVLDWISNPLNDRALGMASLCGIEAVKMCLEMGMDPNAKAFGDRTALMFAAKAGRDPQVIQVLLEAGAEVNAKDQWGETALCYAQKNRGPAKSQMIDLLEGADGEGCGGK